MIIVFGAIGVWIIFGVALYGYLLPDWEDNFKKSGRSDAIACAMLGPLGIVLLMSLAWDNPRRWRLRSRYRRTP